VALLVAKFWPARIVQRSWQDSGQDDKRSRHSRPLSQDVNTRTITLGPLAGGPAPGLQPVRAACGRRHPTGGKFAGDAVCRDDPARLDFADGGERGSAVGAEGRCRKWARRGLAGRAVYGPRRGRPWCAGRSSRARVVPRCERQQSYAENPSLLATGKANEINGRIKANRLCRNQLIIA